MKVKVRTLRRRPYKGHDLRTVETEFGCVFILVDNLAGEVENAPASKQENEYTYPSVADAMRNIDGKPMKFVPVDEVEYLGEKYFNRFKK